MGKYTIIMTTDDNYITPTKVAIYSMIKSGSPDNIYEIHILCSNDLSVYGRRYLQELEEMFPSVSLLFDGVNTESLKEASTHAYIPLASYYRLFISRFIDAEKCLFIDGDVIVLDDVAKLFSYNLGENYIAAVRDCAVQNHNVDFKNHEERLGIPTLAEYVNAGVMLFNLRKIREDRMDTVFIDAIKDGYRFMDQDILNKFCIGRIMHIPLRFNLFSEYYLRVSAMKNTMFERAELIEAQDNPAIIHYPGVYKPWHTRRLKVNKLWWEYAKEILTKDDILQWEDKARRFEEESDITYVLNKIKEKNNIVIFGYTDNCRWLYNFLLKKYPEKDYVFCDNDADKQGIQYQNTYVKSVEDLIDSMIQYYWIIGSQNAYFSISKQLIDNGVRAEDMVRYYHKDKSYYDRLDEEYIKYEETIAGMDI